MSVNVKLKRSLGLPLIALYGLGNILGAGITDHVISIKYLSTLLSAKTKVPPKKVVQFIV